MKARKLPVCNPGISHNSDVAERIVQSLFGPEVSYAQSQMSVTGGRLDHQPSPRNLGLAPIQPTPLPPAPSLRDYSFDLLYPKSAEESDADVLERLEQNRVIRCVKCDKDVRNQTRATSYRVKSISHLCRDLKTSWMVFDNEMKKFRDRYYNR